MVKCLLCKPEDLSSDLLFLGKSWSAYCFGRDFPEQVKNLFCTCSWRSERSRLIVVSSLLKCCFGPRILCSAKQRTSEAVVISGWHGLALLVEGEITVDSVLLQFSKERHIMDRTPERLKKELEEELLLSSEDLRSHAWYHGRIPRQVCALLSSGNLTLMAPMLKDHKTLVL